ncbi:AlkA N-terminal domain-containing protein [Nesterenkonia halophila]
MQAVRARDARFDGRLYFGVTSTGIYCRPSCPSPPPKIEHLTFHPSAAAAQQAGFRACRRCRPEASPGSPQWSIREDTAARAMRLIGDGLVDRDGVDGLAEALGYGPRQVERLLVAELGAGPLALARARRAETARTLLEATRMPITDVAFAAGFTSVRSFNATVRAVFDASPTALRRSVRRGEGRVGDAARSFSAAPPLTLRLAHRMPLHLDSLFGHLIATAVPGVDAWLPDDGPHGTLHRAVRLPHGPGVVALTPHKGSSTSGTPRPHGAITARLRLTDLRDLPTAVQRCRRMLDLDADPAAVDAALAADPALAPLVARTPGVRLPGAPDAHEQAIRTVLGQQISTAAAATLGARLAAAFGTELPASLRVSGGPARLFPTAESLASAAPDDPRWPSMPGSRRATLRRLAGALASGTVRLDVGTPWGRAREELAGLRGIGPWSIEMICLRGLGDPDAFPATDLGTRTAAEAVGLPTAPRALTEHAAAWRPWRSYAAALLWASSDHRVARIPASDEHRPRPIPHSEEESTS